MASSIVFLMVVATCPSGVSGAGPPESGIESTQWYASGVLNCRLQRCGKKVDSTASYLSFGPRPGLEEGEFNLSLFNRDFSVSTKGTVAGRRGKQTVLAVDKEVFEAALRELFCVDVVNFFCCRRGMIDFCWEVNITDLDCTVKRKGVGRDAKIQIKIRARFQVTGQEPGCVEVLKGVATFRGKGGGW